MNVVIGEYFNSRPGRKHKVKRKDIRRERKRKRERERWEKRIRKKMFKCEMKFDWLAGEQKIISLWDERGRKGRMRENT